MVIKGTLTVTINNDLLHRREFQDSTATLSDTPHRCFETMKHFSNKISEKITRESGGTIEISPIIFPVTKDIFLLRFSVKMSELATVYANVVSDDITGYFSYLLDTDRSSLSFKIKARKVLK